MKSFVNQIQQGALDIPGAGMTLAPRWNAPGESKSVHGFQMSL